MLMSLKNYKKKSKYSCSIKFQYNRLFKTVISSNNSKKKTTHEKFDFDTDFKSLEDTLEFLEKNNMKTIPLFSIFVAKPSTHQSYFFR